jgi:hypothetical protein
MSGGSPSVTSEDDVASMHDVRYEELRHNAVESQTPFARHGLVVLLRRGLATWMQEWSRMPSPLPLPSTGERPISCPLLPDTSTEVINVLAAMALGHMREVRI